MSSDDKKQKTIGSDNDELLSQLMSKTEVDKDQVVSMIGNLIGTIGQMGGASGFAAPKPSTQAHPAQKEPQKNIRHIKEMTAAAQHSNDPSILLKDDGFRDWLKHEGCKLKNFPEELIVARQVIDLSGENFEHELGVLTAQKAIGMAKLHARRDKELLSELYWIEAEFHAMSGDMGKATESLASCIQNSTGESVDRDSQAFKELYEELESTREKAKVGLKKQS
ncbi:MAG: hypothetical protein K2X93_18675 [Candidatus Obscuribacterales bacterium]|nr:hypothetical protein [Candidatus Obscuribacterales bacterium]